MATREEIRLINDARSGQVLSQLMLGKRYLHGEGTFTKNPVTAFYWLDRAAQQGNREAGELIGRYIPLEVALRTPDPASLLRWYEQAFDSGDLCAGVVYAKLVLLHRYGTMDNIACSKAWYALEQAALANIPEAQWYLANETTTDKTFGTCAVANIQESELVAKQSTEHFQLHWLTRAAENGIAPAGRSLADLAWAKNDFRAFLHWSLPIATSILAQKSGHASDTVQLKMEDAVLLCRCADALFSEEIYDPAEIERLWEHAAEADYTDAMLSLGLWFARMHPNGARLANSPGQANYKKAIRWLTAAAEKGKSEAWYVIAKIYESASFVHRSLAESELFLEKAANSGHLTAQFELGKRAWHARIYDARNDIRAVYWLQKATDRGHSGAKQMLEKIVSYPSVSPWAIDALCRLGAHVNPLLRARIELAALFGLTQKEALLIDMHNAYHQHCLLIDVSAEHVRIKRRIVLICKNEQHQQIRRIVRLFENVDCGSYGPEGSYRKRLYRLNTELAKSAPLQALSKMAHEGSTFPMKKKQCDPLK